MLLDALIIGGGPAGLSVATGLARQLHTAVVFDSGIYRNQLSRNMHNVVTWDHRSPADFREAARNDIRKRYSTIDFKNVAINEVRKTTSGLFEAVDATGYVWQGKKLVLATGVEDIFPDFDGYKEGWAAGMCVHL
jgi:thioredoxin reductase